MNGAAPGDQKIGDGNAAPSFQHGQDQKPPGKTLAFLPTQGEEGRPRKLAKVLHN